MKLSTRFLSRLGIAVLCACAPLWSAIASAQTSDNLTIMQGATTLANINIAEAPPGTEATALWATVTADCSSITTCWSSMMSGTQYEIVALTDTTQPGGGNTDATISGHLVSDFVVGAIFNSSGTMVDAIALVSDGSTYYSTVAAAYSLPGSTLLTHTVFVPETALQQNLTSQLNFSTTPYTVLATSVEPVPEPGPLALCAAGILAAGWVARRVKRR